MKKIITVLLCVLMLASAFPFGAASNAAATDESAGVLFSVSAARVEGGTRYTVTRTSPTGVLPTQRVIVRTVNLTAFGDIHYSTVFQDLIFTEGTDTQTVTVTEYTSAQMEAASHFNIVDLYQTGTTRSYRFEVLDQEGFLLASVKRDISYDSSYSFNNEWIMEHDGEHLLSVEHYNYYGGYALESHPNDQYLDVSFPNTTGYKTIHDMDGNGYSQGVWTASTNALYNRSGCAPREYLSAVGDRMYAAVCFMAHTIDEGYNYIQVLCDNATTYDGVDPNGKVNNPSLSIFKACFEANSALENNPNYEAYLMFPSKYLTYSEYAGTGGPYEIDIYEKIYQQKFRSASLQAPNTGAFMLDPTVGSLSVRFNTRGNGDDDWQFKKMFARLALVDLQGPTVMGCTVSNGPNKKHNRVTVTLGFSEIVKPEGNTVLRTNWGDLTLDQTGGSYANALSFSGEIVAEAGTVLKIQGISGTVRDLHGLDLSGSYSQTVSYRTVGTTAEPVSLNGIYQIADQGDFYWYADRLRNYPQISAALACDLNMFSTSVNVFPPLAGLAGTFDGAGHAIRNLTVKQEGSSDAGLFVSVFPQGAVRNLTLDRSCLISSYSQTYVGGVAGKNSGTVENCVVDCSVTAAVPSTVGGVAGINLGTIEKCAVTGTASAIGTAQNGNGRSIGGIAGRNDGAIGNCLVGKASLATCVSNAWSNMAVGGVVGTNNGTVSSSLFYALYSSYSTSNITRGSVCGVNTGTLTNCAGVHENTNYFNGAVGSDSGTSTGVVFPERNAFFSGEVCYLLNGGVTDGTQTWYQTVNSGALPSFSGDTVYNHGTYYVNTVVHIWTTEYEWVWDDEISQYNVTATARCRMCPETFSVQITSEVFRHKDPTCKSEGFTDYIARFSGYTEYDIRAVVKTDVIPVIAHSWAFRTLVQPTCTEEGIEQHYCTRCGYSDAAYVLPARGHQTTHYLSQSPTAEEPGVFERWFCTICDKYFTDEECTNEVEWEDLLIDYYSCGDDLTWRIENGVLYISGTGAMWNINFRPGWRNETFDSVVIEEGVTTVGESAFSNIASLKSVTISDSVTVISAYAFAFCRNLKTVTIGEGVGTIEYLAFADCASLTYVYVPESVTTIWDDAFDGCRDVTLYSPVSECAAAEFAGSKDNVSFAYPDGNIAVRTDGLNITVTRATAIKDVFIVDGEGISSYREIKNGSFDFKYNFTYLKCDTFPYAYTVLVPDYGTYTVFARMKDGTTQILTVDIVPDEAGASAALSGRNATVTVVTGGKTVKVVRIALGEFTTSRDIKNAHVGMNVTPASNKYYDSAAHFSLVYNGTYTYIVEFTDGTSVLGSFEFSDPTLTTPEFTANRIYGIAPNVRVIRYLEGDRSGMSSADFKNAGATVVMQEYVDAETGTYTLKAQTVGTYTFLIEYTNGTVCTVVADIAPIPNSFTVGTYDELAAAIEAAEPGAEIILGKQIHYDPNVSQASNVLVFTKPMTIDLNGKTLDSCNNKTGRVMFILEDVQVTLIHYDRLNVDHTVYGSGGFNFQ